MTDSKGNLPRFKKGDQVRFRGFIADVPKGEIVKDIPSATITDVRLSWKGSPNHWRYTAIDNGDKLHTIEEAGQHIELL